MWMFVWLTANSCSSDSHKHSLLQACALRMPGFLPQHLITYRCHFQLGVRRERCKAKFPWGTLWYKVIFSPGYSFLPVGPPRFWMLISEGRRSPGGQDAGARPQEPPCASPSLSSAVSRASPDLSKIRSTPPPSCFPEAPLPTVPFCPQGGPFISTHIFPLSQESGFWIAFQRIHIIKLPFLILTPWYKEILPTSRGAMYLLKRYIF